MGDTHADIQKHVAVYMKVFGALAVLTMVTVGVSYVHLGVAGNVALAMVIALVKGSLVCCYFMHLIDERKLIYWILILTVAFFFVLMAVPALTISDAVRLH